MAAREVLEGRQEQGRDESVRYRLVVDPAPSSVLAVKVYDTTDLTTDIAATVMPSGNPTISGDEITLANLTGLTLGKTYRVEVSYTDDVNTLEPWFEVVCVR